MTIQYLAYAIALFVVLRFTSHVIKAISITTGLRKILTRIFPLIEFSIWIGFGLWVLNKIFANYPYYNVIISASIGCLLLIAGWYFLRDFVAGIILKTEIPFEKNQRIKTVQAEGILKKMGYRSLEIESSKGELIKVPYSQLAKNAINLQNTEESMHGFETSLTISPSKPFQDVKDRISKEILQLPWASILHQPSVKLDELAHEQNKYLINFHASCEKHADLICQHLKMVFEQEKGSK